MEKLKVRFYQCMAVLGLAAYLSQKLLNGQLSYFINRRFFYLTLIAIVGMTIMVILGLQDIFDSEQPSSGEKNRKNNFAWIFLLPVLSAIMGLSWVLVIQLFVLVFLVGLFRLNGTIRRELDGADTWLAYHDHDESAEHNHTHSDDQSARFHFHSLYLFVIPILIGVLVVPQPLTTASLEARGISLTAPIRPGAAPAASLFTVETDRDVLDWITLFNTETDATQYIGETIDVTGFVYHDSLLDATQFYVGRFVVTCCVADAFAIGMAVNGSDAIPIPDNTWVNVVGTLDVMDLGGTTVPVIQADSVIIVDPPEQPYIYP